MAESKVKLTKDGIHAILVPFYGWTIGIVLFFLAAGRFDLPRAWIYFINSLGAIIIEGIILWKVIPELANRRGEVQTGTKKWDRIWLVLFLFTLSFVTPIVAGLDIGRFLWTYLGIEFLFIGFVPYWLGLIITEWAMIENQFFEGTVRIAKDRGHKVCTTGPYSILRHPGYVGMISSVISIPFLLGSIVAFIPSGIIVVLVVTRTSLEDNLLQKELEGYVEYTKKVKKRLVPGVW